MATGVVFATKAARVSYNTFRLHQRNDPEFAAQIREAEAQGAELLHYACFQRAVEGNLEPVYFQGQVVGHIRKFDTRLQIEFLRGHRFNRKRWCDYLLSDRTAQTNYFAVPNVNVTD